MRVLSVKGCGNYFYKNNAMHPF